VQRFVRSEVCWLQGVAVGAGLRHLGAGVVSSSARRASATGMVVSVKSVWVTSGTEALATRSTAMRPKIGFSDERREHERRRHERAKQENNAQCTHKHMYNKKGTFPALQASDDNRTTKGGGSTQAHKQAHNKHKTQDERERECRKHIEMQLISIRTRT
jgi:ABC-type nickel/cobalt efflux system permease component RcnA